MEKIDRVWLVVNEQSGSNTPAALDRLRACLESQGVDLAKTICFPSDPIPSVRDLDAEGIAVLAIYTGDGTINAAIAALARWSGAILVLPGGTMNLLCKRLHGDAQLEQIVAATANGGACRTRISMAHCEAGMALAGLLAGPGTRWNIVREAMRDFDVGGMMEGVVEAMSETTGDALARLADPRIGRSAGYPLLEITPGEHGLQVDGFSADNAGEFVEQGWALLRRRFRDGPHDRLGVFAELTIENAEGSEVQMLFDGEPQCAPSPVKIVLARSEVDLLATGHAS